MNKKIYGWIGAAIVLVITVTVLIFAFFPFDNGYVADSKAEITENIDSSREISSFSGVDQYLREWGMPSFDRAKFSYFEYYFNRYCCTDSFMRNIFNGFSFTRLPSVHGNFG